MKLLKNTLTGLMAASVLLAGCSSMNKTQKGAVIGTAGGAAAGAIIGKVAGNAALGAIIGAAVGGVTGTVIGKKMDKQAAEIKNEVPGATVERVGEGIVVEFADKNAVLFGFDKADLTPATENSLNKLVQILKEYPDTNIEVQGHTDSRGTDEYNMQLSQRRATSVAGYLTRNGVASSRVTTKGYGESAPVATNDTDEGRAQNRRVNFLITANEKMKADAKKESNN
ncbi:OmpA family protein [Pseudoflavitalea rhizosphaerae]|uniref:OmpA family protein n=1 Tax=Pseudoflavitalea rhizosphaerae TaxID=1884793 RepID=UPI000F8C5B72|nr:OmpA family protein [Pseudoflavitalea rhizosphaerae]